MVNPDVAPVSFRALQPKQTLWTFPHCESLCYLGSYGAAKPIRSLAFAYSCHTVMMQSLLEIGSDSL